METIANAFKIIEGVNTFIGDTLDYILAIYKYCEEFETFIYRYLHEHPIYKFCKEFETLIYEYLHEHLDENVYTEIKCSNPSFSVIIEVKEIFNYQIKILTAFTINNKKMNNDQILILKLS